MLVFLRCSSYLFYNCSAGGQCRCITSIMSMAERYMSNLCTDMLYIEELYSIKILNLLYWKKCRQMLFKMLNLFDNK